MYEITAGSIAYEGSDFRVRQQAGDSESSHEIVDCRATVIVIAMTKVTFNDEVVVIEEERPVYGDDGTKIRLPGGMVRGSFDVSEAPLIAGLRQLTEATGYNRDPCPVPYSAPDTNLFAMPNSSAMINHPRYLLWLRNVVKRSMSPEDSLIGTEPIGALLTPVFEKKVTPHFPAEAVFGFSRAIDRFGEGRLLSFLMDGQGQELNDFAKITKAMEPWLTLVPDQE
jgi:hypothetical protein